MSGREKVATSYLLSPTSEPTETCPVICLVDNARIWEEYEPCGSLLIYILITPFIIVFSFKHLHQIIAFIIFKIAREPTGLTAV